MIPKIIISFFLICLVVQARAQHSIDIDATLNPGQKTLSIKQQITYKNTSSDTLRELYLFDWANSFSSKTSALGKRFAENYNSSFHFEKEEDRGKTTIEKIYSAVDKPLQWERGEEIDILKVIPETALLPGNSYTFSLQYLVSEEISENKKHIILEGDNRIGAPIYLEKNLSFESIETDKLTVVTNLQNGKINPPVQVLLIDRIAHFLDKKLGPYPFKKMVVSETDYKTNPVYGLNQLPSFISPYPDGFEYS